MSFADRSRAHAVIALIGVLAIVIASLGTLSMSSDRIAAGSGVDLLNAPQRLVDTRAGFDTVDGLYTGIGQPLAGSTLDVEVAGRAGIPADATVVVLNVTAVAPVERGYVTVTRRDRPPECVDVKLLRGSRHRDRGDLPGGIDGSVSISTSASPPSRHDVAGHLATRRLHLAVRRGGVDTRGVDTVHGQPLAIGRRSADSTLDVLAAGRGGYPADTVVVVLTSRCCSRRSGVRDLHPAGPTVRTRPPSTSIPAATPRMR